MPRARLGARASTVARNGSLSGPALDRDVRLRMPRSQTPKAALSNRPQSFLKVSPPIPRSRRSSGVQLPAPSSLPPGGVRLCRRAGLGRAALAAPARRRSQTAAALTPSAPRAHPWKPWGIALFCELPALLRRHLFATGEPVEVSFGRSVHMMDPYLWVCFARLCNLSSTHALFRCNKISARPPKELRGQPRPPHSLWLCRRGQRGAGHLRFAVRPLYLSSRYWPPPALWQRPTSACAYACMCRRAGPPSGENTRPSAAGATPSPFEALLKA